MWIVFGKLCEFDDQFGVRRGSSRGWVWHPLDQTNKLIEAFASGLALALAPPRPGRCQSDLGKGGPKTTLGGPCANSIFNLGSDGGARWGWVWHPLDQTSKLIEALASGLASAPAVHVQRLKLGELEGVGPAPPRPGRGQSDQGTTPGGPQDSPRDGPGRPTGECESG